MDIKPTKEIMAQYNDIKEEIKELNKEIEKAEKSIEKLMEEGTVCDKVKGGIGGIQGFKIEGFPVVEYQRRRRVLKNKVHRLQKKENDLIELKDNIERYIEKIPVSRDRRIFRMIFIENKTQKQVAKELVIDRSLVSKIISKYL